MVLSIPGFTAEASITADKHNDNVSSILEYIDKDENILPARGGPGTCQPGIDKCYNYQRRIWHIDCTYTTEPCHCGDVCTNVKWYEYKPSTHEMYQYLEHRGACLFMCEDDDCTPVLLNSECGASGTPYLVTYYTCADGSSFSTSSIAGLPGGCSSEDVRGTLLVSNGATTDPGRRVPYTGYPF